VTDRPAVIVDTSSSPHARLRPVAVDAVRLRDDFWAPRMVALREVTLPTQYDLMEETGRIDNFRRASGKIRADFQGIYFNDSDVHKWIEAAAWALAYQPDANLQRLTDLVIAEVAAAQGEDGYLNTYHMFDLAGERWSDLATKHEMYLAGHLFQAAVAHHRATGRRDLLDVACRFADNIDSVFGPGKRRGTDGHPEPEMALVELYRETGEPRYLALARFLLDERGHGLVGGDSNLQDHKPFRDLEEVIGHAVRALYLNCGAADIFAETGEQALADTLGRLWHNLAERRMYVTGGVGALYAGEALGRDYELPNASAYSETCAAIANLMWQWRMFLLSGEARFVDVLELALYNGALAGISLDGKGYYYVNPLADRGGHRRQPWFGCACCPPNIARILAQLTGYFYATSDDGLWVNLYAASDARLPWRGQTVALAQDTAYPWDGDVALRISPAEDAEFTLFLRVPVWAESAAASVNGKSAGAAAGGGHLAIRRRWSPGDEVSLSLGMRAEWLAAHPHIEADAGRLALRRGPLVYAVEQADNPGLDPWCFSADPSRELTAEHAPDLFGGVTVLRGEADAVPADAWSHSLYMPEGRLASHRRPARFAAIPYYAWANREPGPMQVWLPRR
jgi:hypothetical protein